MATCDGMDREKPKGFWSTIPIWAWAFLIAGIILLGIVLVIQEKEPIIDLEGKTCNELVDMYNDCLNEKGEAICKGYYSDAILDCYGDELLKDQMALNNQTR